MRAADCRRGLRLSQRVAHNFFYLFFSRTLVFCAHQVVAYQFYLGRLNVFEEKYVEAEACLDYAFRHCHRSSAGNKRRILQFLVPVKLLHSRFPQDRLLDKYALTEFRALIHAIKNGDLEKFNANLQQNQRFFIQKGIYLILEKLKIFVYRNLFRKVYVPMAVHSAAPPRFSAYCDCPLRLSLTHRSPLSACAPDDCSPSQSHVPRVGDGRSECAPPAAAGDTARRPARQRHRHVDGRARVHPR